MTSVLEVTYASFICMFGIVYNMCYCVRVRAKSLWLGPTLCGPIDCTPPGSSVPGILQARILELVASPSS